MIVDKSFGHDFPTPDYLKAKYTMQSRHGGLYGGALGPYVNDRFKKLVDKLGAQFDCDPRFEGVAFQESSPSLDEAELDASGYTPENIETH
jgi:hypothetical protein